MNAILSFFETFIDYWPLVVFLALLLSGLNFPISEDTLIIFSVGVCHGDKTLLVPTLCALYFGIILSDTVSYFLGYFCSKGAGRLKRVQKILNSPKKDKIIRRINEHGFFTFVSFRFIPFGVRNLLFLTSGFFHVKFLSFIFFDYIAALISSMTLFWLFYLVGSDATLIFRCIGGVLLLAVVIFIVHNIVQIRRDFANETRNFGK